MMEDLLFGRDDLTPSGLETTPLLRRDSLLTCFSSGSFCVGKSATGLSVTRGESSAWEMVIVPLLLGTVSLGGVALTGDL